LFGGMEPVDPSLTLLELGCKGGLLIILRDQRYVSLEERGEPLPQKVCGADAENRFELFGVQRFFWAKPRSVDHWTRVECINHAIESHPILFVSR